MLVATSNSIPEPSHVLLIARPNALADEAHIVSALGLAGYAVVHVPTLPASIPQPAIVLVHLLSTLINPRNISGYVSFVRDYAERKQEADLRLVVLSPPHDQGPETMIGWGALVDAYLREPFTVDALLHILARLGQEASASSYEGLRYNQSLQGTRRQL